MTDVRIEKLAKVITEYSTSVRQGDRVYITASPIAQSLTLAVIEQVIKLGGLPHIVAGSGYHHLDLVPGALEAMLKYGSDEQIKYVNPFERLAVGEFDVRIAIKGETNTKSLSNVDPARIAMLTAARRELTATLMRRTGSGDLRWCVTMFPTNASAQDADMSLREYEDFVYGASHLDDPDPVARWREIAAQQQKYIDWLKGKRRVQVKGPNCDLTFGITDRIFINADGKKNMPDGEIFTGPVEDSVNGWIRFRYPAIYGGQEVTDIELWFENGKVAKEKAEG